MPYGASQPEVSPACKLPHTPLQIFPFVEQRSRHIAHVLPIVTLPDILRVSLRTANRGDEHHLRVVPNNQYSFMMEAFAYVSAGTAPV